MSHEQPTLGPDDAAVRDGRAYSTGHIFLAIADNADAELRITLAATRRGHFRIGASGGGAFEVRLFEDTTFSGAGTPITPTNNRRDGSPAAAVTVLRHTPTVDVDGTELFQSFVPGAAGGPSAVGGPGEWLLAEGTEYLVRLTNTSGGAIDMAITVEFAEDGAGL